MENKLLLEFCDRLFIEIQSARKSNLDALTVRKTKYNVNILEDPFCCVCNGKILALDGLEYFIHQLLDDFL